MIGKRDKTVSQIIQTNSFFLVGLMGSGKSTVGKLLADHLNIRFIDSDRYIEKKLGVDISHIFDIEGEEGFRIREESAIEALSQLNNIVLSTGGGTVLSAINRMHLARGVVFYLQASPDNIIKRLEGDKTRPLLQQSDRLQVLERLLNDRERYYTEVADYIIMVDQLTPLEVVDAILDKRIP